jgi:hypothetical protein
MSNEAQRGGLSTVKVSASPSGSEAIGLKLNDAPARTALLAVPRIVGGRLGADRAAVAAAGGEAAGVAAAEVAAVLAFTGPRSITPRAGGLLSPQAASPAQIRTTDAKRTSTRIASLSGQIEDKGIRSVQRGRPHQFTEKNRGYRPTLIRLAARFFFSRRDYFKEDH